VNNWELAPLLRFVTGTPFTVTEGQDESFTGNGGDRPDLVPGVNPINYAKINLTIVGRLCGPVLSESGGIHLEHGAGHAGQYKQKLVLWAIYIQDDAQL